MVAITGDAAVVVQPGAQSSLVDAPASQASIAAYLDSGERMLVVTDIIWKLCVGLIVLILVAWTAGLLPGAVRLL